MRYINKDIFQMSVKHQFWHIARNCPKTSDGPSCFLPLYFKIILSNNGVGKASAKSFCPIIMALGRPKKADPGSLYFFAHDFYWQFRQMVEGHFRWRFDEGEYKHLAAGIDSQEIRLNHDQNLAIARAVIREVQDGRLTEAEKEARLRELAASNRFVTRDWLHRQAGEEARKQVKVPGRPDVMRALLQAGSPGEVRKICEDAFVPRIIQIEPGVTKEVRMPNWPIPVGSPLPRYLSEYASEFIVARNDKRFPVSDRPTSRLKQLWFMARALAGALYGLKLRTAINLVGSKRPEEVFEESRAGKPLRRSVRRRDK